MKYIDADKLKAEIYRRYEENRKRARYDDYYRGMNDGLDHLEQFLDSLPEQPELTIMTNERLDKEAVTFCFDRGITIRLGQAKEFAHHFYKLGLNSKK